MVGRLGSFFDGRPVATVDAYAPGDTNDIDLWHVAGLPAGRHALRIVTLDQANARSDGARVEVALVLIATTLLRVGTGCTLTSMLVDLRTEATERAASIRTACTDDALLRGVDQLVRQLSRQSLSPSSG
jgi:hypothetical protein